MQLFPHQDQVETSVSHRFGAAGWGREDIPASTLLVSSCTPHTGPVPVPRTRPPSPTPGPTPAAPRPQPHWSTPSVIAAAWENGEEQFLLWHKIWTFDKVKTFFTAGHSETTSTRTAEDSGLLGPSVQTRCSRIFKKYANKQNLFFYLSCVFMLKEGFHGLTVIRRLFDPDLTLTVATC